MDGGLVQFGPSSIFFPSSPVTAATQNVPFRSATPQPDQRTNWARDLPEGCGLDRNIHDEAIEVFDAYHAQWCSIVDVPTFCSELDNRIDDLTYSPLLHCTIVYLGLFMLRHRWSDAYRAFKNAFDDHCSKLVLSETSHPTLASIRAFNLYGMYVMKS